MANKKEINFDTLDKLIAIFCTGEECAAVLNIDYDTLNARIKEKFKIGFSDYFKKKAGVGRASLRRRQFEMSKTNPALAIWLGKQYLAQKDHPLIDQSTHEHFNVTIEIVDENKTAQESGNRIGEFFEV